MCAAAAEESGAANQVCTGTQRRWRTRALAFLSECAAHAGDLHQQRVLHVHRLRHYLAHLHRQDACREVILGRQDVDDRVQQPHRREHYLHAWTLR